MAKNHHKMYGNMTEVECEYNENQLKTVGEGWAISA
jgi:hypothetical protein